MEIKTELYHYQFIEQNPEFTGCVIDKYGNKYWYLNGKWHREEGPACEWANGSKEWYLNGLRHREEGPAIEFADGHKEWHLNGKLHRTDGPAVIDELNGTKYWYLNGEETTEEQVMRLHKLKNFLL